MAWHRDFVVPCTADDRGWLSFPHLPTNIYSTKNISLLTYTVHVKLHWDDQLAIRYKVSQSICTFASKIDYLIPRSRVRRANVVPTINWLHVVQVYILGDPPLPSLPPTKFTIFLCSDTSVTVFTNCWTHTGMIPSVTFYKWKLGLFTCLAFFSPTLTRNLALFSVFYLNHHTELHVYTEFMIVALLC